MWSYLLTLAQRHNPQPKTKTMTITITSDVTPEFASDDRTWTVETNGRACGSIALEKRDYGIGHDRQRHGVPFVSLHPRWLADCYRVELWDAEGQTLAEQTFPIPRDRDGNVTGQTPRAQLAAARKWAAEHAPTV